MVKGVTVGYKGLQGVTGGYRGLLGVTRGCSVLYEITGRYKRFQGVTGGYNGYRGLQGVKGFSERKNKLIRKFETNPDSKSNSKI